MSHDELKYLQKAEQALVQKLRQVPDFVRLEKLRETIRAYETPVAAPVAKPEPAPKPTVAVGADMKLVWHTSGSGKSMSALIIEESEAILRARGTPAFSGWIGDELAKRGIDIPKDRRSQRISAALSGNNKFVNVKGQGYGLKEWPLGQSGPQESETPDSSELSGVPRPNGLPLSH